MNPQQQNQVLFNSIQILKNEKMGSKPNPSRQFWQFVRAGVKGGPAYLREMKGLPKLTQEDKQLLKLISSDMHQGEKKISQTKYKQCLCDIGFQEEIENYDSDVNV